MSGGEVFVIIVKDKHFGQRIGLTYLFQLVAYADKGMEVECLESRNDVGWYQDGCSGGDGGQATSEKAVELVFGLVIEEPGGDIDDGDEDNGKESNEPEFSGAAEHGRNLLNRVETINFNRKMLTIRVAAGTGSEARCYCGLT